MVDRIYVLGENPRRTRHMSWSALENPIQSSDRFQKSTYYLPARLGTAAISARAGL